jgi:hypothetical protein
MALKAVLTCLDASEPEHKRSRRGGTRQAGVFCNLHVTQPVRTLGTLALVARGRFWRAKVMI